MSSCTQPGCSGTIAADGYCDTCGVKAPAAAASRPAPAPGPVAGSRLAPGPPTGPSGPSGSGGPSGSSGSSGPSGSSGSSGPVAPTALPPAVATAAPTALGGPAAASGRVCGRDGCAGTIAADGYCDTCGLSVAPTSHRSSPGSGPATGGNGHAGDAPPAVPGLSGGAGRGSSRSGPGAPTIAAPEAPDTSSRLQTTAGQPTSRRTHSSSRTTSARTGIGRGLVAVAPTPVGDPASAIMTDEEVQAVLGTVPEDQRNCTACGRPVGRSADGKPGRVKGFCGTCRTPFDFVTNAPALARGELVGGQYQILGPLAHGGLGWIYLGQDRAVSDRWVVLKGLLNLNDVDAALAAVAERQFLAQIDHPNIVKIYNFISHRGAGYIVMEFVGGESLNAKLKRRREQAGRPDPLPPAQAIAYILGIMPAFSYLHEHRLVYNDMKPANIMAVGDDVKVIDVGAVMQVDDQQAAIFGTQGFQAPEVATLGPSVASDLYTIGRTLAVLMLRFVFHEGPYLYTLPSREEEPLFAQWESLHRFLLRACAYHPDDRFQSAGEMNEQLLGVLREMAAITDGRPRAYNSTLFDPDQLTALLTSSADAYDVTRPDWRVLPPTSIDPDDPSAAFLLGLPERDPARSLDLLEAAVQAGQVEASAEVELFRARQQVALGVDPAAPLATVEAANPWEWRSRWYRAIHQLQSGYAAEAAEGFSRVWTELPGESAPKLAVALAAEVAGAYDRAAEVYDLVASADSTYVSAAFGLARCRAQTGPAQAVVEAYNRVPPSSAAHYDAQVASARALVGGGPSGRPTVADLHAASATIERLQLDAAERARLSADVYERALAGLLDGSIPSGAATLLGHELSERSLREGLELAYRTQARLAVTAAERIALIDRANEVRPRSLL